MTPHRTPPSLRPWARLSAVASAVTAAALLATACGPGHVPDGANTDEGSSKYAQQCSLSNPYRAEGENGTNPDSGSLTIEKQWVRAYVDEAYLWYDKVPDIAPLGADYSNETSFYLSIDSYFSDLTVSGVAEDQFSFTYPTKLWNELSQSGVTMGYGMELYGNFDAVPRNLRVAYVDPTSPAATAGLRRGDVLVAVDGQLVANGDRNALINGLYPAAAGDHEFVVSRGGIEQPAMTATASNFASDPIPLTRVIAAGNGAKVGYMLFNAHVLTAQDQLIDAMTDFRTQGVTDLVIDMRYNGGGYLFLASQLAYMIAGEARTKDKVFEQLQYNDKRKDDTDAADASFGFFSCRVDTNTGACPTNPEALPALNLSRVWVLSGPGTCSASEAVVNGLRGVDVEVNIIGGTTCGKPYGFTAKDNCGISYFPIEFQGVNAKGFGDYGNGFAPTCAVADDFAHELGDSAEGMLAAALNHRTSGQCPSASLAKTSAPEGRVLKGPERSNKFLLPGKGGKLR